MIAVFMTIPQVSDKTGHFILRAVPLKIIMTGTHSAFSFLIDCHFLVLAVAPVDLNDSLIMW